MTRARGTSPAGPSGPVDAARNRFYQVPHCSGMGYRDPSAAARMRGIKAEGGWALAPATIAAAVYAGHRYARELDTVVDRDRPPFRREVAALAPI